MVLQQHEVEVRAPQAAPERAVGADSTAQVSDVAADREVRAASGGIAVKFADEPGHDREGLALVELPVPAVQHVVMPDRVPEGVVVQRCERGVARPEQVPSERFQAPGAEARSARFTVHEPDAGHDLIQVHDVHAAVDALDAAVEQVTPEDLAVDAGSVDRLGLPVIPVALGRLSGHVAADLVQERGRRLVDPGDEGDHGHREQDALARLVRSHDVIGGQALRVSPHAVDRRAELGRDPWRHGDRRDELHLAVPLHWSPPALKPVALFLG
jgi:hypothetical protein